MQEILILIGLYILGFGTVLFWIIKADRQEKHRNDGK